MNTDDGSIHQLLAGETLKELAARIPCKESSLVELRNLPLADCPTCRGTGVRGMSQAGRRIPCECTNPKP